MQEETDLQKKFESLPSDLKDALTSVDLSEKLQRIGKDQGLHLDQVDALMEEIGFVMLGETKPDEFGSKVSSRLGLPPEKVGPLVKSVDEEIFKPIRFSLMELHQKSAVRGQPIGQVIQNDESTLNAKVSGPDYDMSRAAILSAIENPTPAEVKVASVVHRTPEPTDPKEYLLRREDVVKNMQKKLAGAAQSAYVNLKKPSLTEEALLVAQKKASEKDALNKEGGSPQTPPLTQLLARPTGLNVPPRSSSTSIAFSPKVTALSVTPSLNITSPPAKPADKLSGVIQVPRTTTTIESLPADVSAGAPAKTSGADPYREPV